MSIQEDPARKSSPRETALLSDQAATEAVHATAEKVAAASKRGVEAGAEIIQFSTQAVQRSMDQVATIFGLASGDEHARNVTHNTTRNLDAILQCGTALADGGHELAHIWTDSFRSGVMRNVENAERLLRCRTLVELGAVQSDIMRQSIEFMIQNNLRLSESSVQIARMAAERCRVAPL
ncbi:phasin family protein [Mesorhizobium sp. KR1-2]|uniref:phasin family protein n=1 Tax=Mesorhizobium sp. KR1-2 TaxID=3156609 RepID=UPI0032B50A58